MRHVGGMSLPPVQTLVATFISAHTWAEMQTNLQRVTFATANPLQVAFAIANPLQVTLVGGCASIRPYKAQNPYADKFQFSELSL